MSSGDEEERDNSEEEDEIMEEPGMGPEDEDEIDQDDFDLFVMAMETGSLHKLSSTPLRSTPQPQLYSPLSPTEKTLQQPLEISLSKYQDAESSGGKKIRGGGDDDEDKPEEFPTTETAQRPHTFDSPSNTRNSKSVSTKTVFVDISDENDIGHDGVKSHSCPDLRTNFLDLTEDEEPVIHERPKKRRKLEDASDAEDEAESHERSFSSSRTPDQNSRSRYYADQGPGSDKKNKKRKIDNCIYCGSQDHIQYKCPERRCSSCNGVGHLKRECPVLHLQECFRCGKKGHLVSKCKVPSSELADPSHYRLKTSTSLIGSGTGRRYCFNCGHKGHTAKNCDDYPVEEYIVYHKRHGEFTGGGRRKRHY